MMAFLRRNWEYKLLSLVLSILLYFIASTQRNRSLSSTQSVQPQVVGLPLELVVKTPPPPGQVTLTGPPEELARVRKEGIKVTVSAVGARAGKNFLPVTYVLPREARGRVALEAPPTLEVELEARLTRSIPVRVLFQNQPPPGFEYAPPSSLPVKVEASGPASEVARVDRVVALLDNTDSGEALSREVSVVAQDTNQQVVSSVTLQPTQVRASLTLRQAPATKTLVLSGVFSGEPAVGTHLTAYTFSPSTVVVRGEPALLSRLSSLKISVSVAGLAKNETRQIVLTPPAGISLLGQRVAQLTLTVDAPPAASPTLKPAPTPRPAGE